MLRGGEYPHHPLLAIEPWAGNNPVTKASTRPLSG